MHEVSLVADLVSECERRAAGPARPARSRPPRLEHPRAGAAAGLPDAHRGRPPGATPPSRPRRFDVELRCGCGFAGALGHDDLISGSVAVCPACGEVSTLPRTAELELLEVRTAAP